MRFVPSARHLLLGSSVVLSLLAPRLALADDVKRQCVDASTEGQTLRRDEKLLEAREQMLLCARDACPNIVRSHCIKWLREVEDQTPSVVVRAQDGDGSDLTDGKVTIDGQAGKLDGHPVALNPGEHVVVIERADGARKEEKVLLADGEKSRLLVLRFPRTAQAEGTGGSTGGSPNVPEPPPESKPAVPTGAWVLGGVGIVSLGAFAYFGLSAQSDFDALKTTCSPNCTDDQKHSAYTKAIVSDVALGVGVAALGGAVLWTILSHTGGKASASASASTGPSVRVDVAPTAGGMMTGLSGSF